VVAPDIPGFVWNRLRFCALAGSHRARDALSSSSQHDRLSARTWTRSALVHHRATTAMAPGGAKTCSTVAADLFPTLESELEAGLLGAIDLPDRDALSRKIAERDQTLAALLRAE
jgi:hypothetical protein